MVVKRALLSLVIGCGAPLVPLLMARSFTGQVHRLMTILSVFLSLPGQFVALAGVGGNRNRMTYSLVIMGSCVFYTVVAYALTSPRLHRP